MGRVTDQALAAAGLDDLRDELPRRLRAGGTLTAEERARLERADILVLGALADHVRAALAGDRVTIATQMDHCPRGNDPSRSRTGSDVLRAVAMARLSGSGGVAVDVAEVGLELAQVALAFGADTWRVAPAPKRSLTRLAVDLDALVRRAGRVPVFVTASDAGETRFAGAGT